MYGAKQRSSCWSPLGMQARAEAQAEEEEELYKLLPANKADLLC